MIDALVQNSAERVSRLRRHDLVRNFRRGLSLMLSERTTRIYGVFLLFILTLGLVGPWIAPYEYDQRMRGDDGGLLRIEEPSAAHPLGTTEQGFDVLSRVLYGARPTIVAGILGGSMIIGIGLTIGLTAGYVGGRVDDVLMRFTDLIYGVPLIPATLVLIALLGVGYFQAIFIIGALLWRGSARVIRSQALQIRERPFILAAKATGASRPYIILKHILPNVAPMAVLFFALGMGYTIIVMAALAFLGVADPFIPSWGVMIRNAYNSGVMGTAWFWALPPGFLISLTVLSLFMFGRGYENVVSGEDEGDQALAQAT